MKEELNKYIKSKKTFGEVLLFREMQRYLSLKYVTTFVMETHQHYVRFNSPSTKCTFRREISDLWLITYSPKNKKAKMTFLQAKFEKKKKKLNIMPFNFNGDYFQYELLSKRPDIVDTKYNFPKTLLSNSVSDSIGTYGIFYFDNDDNLDFAFSTASDITTKNLVDCKTKNRQLYFKDFSYYEIISSITKYFDIELRGALNADYFEFGLLNLLIGSPIENDKDIVNFLKIYFENRKDENISNFKEFLNSIDDSPINNNILDNFERNPNILLINVDGAT